MMSELYIARIQADGCVLKALEHVRAALAFLRDVPVPIACSDLALMEAFDRLGEVEEELREYADRIE